MHVGTLTQTGIQPPPERRPDARVRDTCVPIVTCVTDVRNQWKLSPQAHEPPALGLSIVKPCC